MQIWLNRGKTPEKSAARGVTDTNHLSWSEQIYRIFELPPDQFAATPEAFLERVHPDDREFVSNSYNESVKNHQPYDIQHRIITLTGEEKWVHEICTTFYDKAGNPLRSLGVVHDITEQRNSIELLQRERDMFLHGSVITFTWQNSENWPVEQVSPNVIEILGYSAQEFLDGSLFYASLIHANDIERVTNEVITASQGKGKSFTHQPYRLVTRNGQVVWVLDHTTIIRNSDGTISHFQGYLVDITHTMNIAEKLRENKERLELIINGANLGTWDWDIETGHVMFNQRWAEMIGYRLDEIKSDVSTWKKIIHPDEHDDIMRILTDHLEGRTSVYMTEHRLKHKSGKWIWVLDVGKVFKRDIKGRPLRALGIHLDITERVRIQTELVETNSQLEIAIAIAENMAEKAEAANHAKSVFLSNMSHELRTPLSAILGYTQLFSGDSSLTPKQQSGIKTMHQSGEHLLMLINDVLDLSKIESGKMELVKTEFQLPGFLLGVADIIGGRAAEKGIDFRYEAEGALPVVIGADELRLRQVLLNLLSNAVKFTDNGHCLLRIQSQPTRFNKATLTFIVEDSGPGVRKRMQKKIFQPFQQTGERLKYSEGSGLGLAISSKLVQLMGGDLQLVSPIEKKPKTDEEGGSRFTFTIEAEVSNGITSSNQYKRRIVGYILPNGDTKQKRILIVDDNASNRAVLHDSLEPLGFIIEEAMDGSEVLVACMRFQPDVILMDLRIPNMDGLTAAKLIKGHQDFNHIPIIAITASTSERQKRKQHCLEIGFSDYITKPYSSSKLLRIIAIQLAIGLQYAYDTTAPDNTSKIIAPPGDILNNLVSLAQSGDIHGVVEQSVDIALMESGRYSAFANRLGELADNFQLIEIEKFITIYQED